MQNYKTTIIGAMLAVAQFLSQFQANGGHLNDWSLWLVPAFIAALGYVAKDAGVTGTAKILIGCLCMMSLTSCAGLIAFAASPLGQASIVTAEAMGKQLAKATEEKVIEQIILKAQAQIAALNAHGVNANTGKEVVRQSELIGLASVVTAAQQQYTGLTGHAYVLPKNPLASVVTP